MTGERSLVLAVPDWPVVAAGADLADPVVVVEGNRVIAASPAARAEAVRVGLRRREAQARCPQLRVVAGDRARDARAFEPVVAAVAELCPRLEVLEPGRCGFPTRGPARYFGGDEPLARQVRQAAEQALNGDRSETGGTIPVRVGVADGRFAAGLAATTSEEAQAVVPAGITRSWLAPLPVGVLVGAGSRNPVSAGLVDLFVRLGLIQLGQVAGLAEGDVLARFGPEGITAHRLASGLDDHPAVLGHPAPELAVATVFEEPLERVDQAAFAARTLAEALHQQLATRGETCTLLAVVAETEYEEQRIRRWRHDGLSARAVAERVRWQLDGWLNGSAAVRPTGGITLLRLIPEEVVPARGVQLALWGSAAVVPEQVGKVVARLEGLLGPEAVTVPTWRGGREPGRDVQAVPVSTVDLTTERTSAAPPMVVADPDRPPWPGRLPTPSPTTIFSLPPDRNGRRPVGVEVFAQDGTRVGVNGRAQPPETATEVVLDGRHHRIRGWAGPWPVIERWWDEDRRRRQARFQFLLDDGTAWLLVLEDGRWHVAAAYD